MGGAGTLHLDVKYADKWAAIAPIVPAAFTMQPAILEKAKDMPVIIVQGGADFWIESRVFQINQSSLTNLP